MSTRQKSFFDQDHRKQKSNKSYWNRGRNSNDLQRTNEQAPKDKMPASPIKASSQSRSKLKAFQFIEGRPMTSSVGENKKNETFHISQKGKEEGKENTMAPGAVANTQSKPPPSTPATRLPLADLIGNIEDIGNDCTGLNISPDERITWAHVQSPDIPGDKATTVRKREKRARSSSPISSSQNDTSAFFPANKEPFDLENMQQSLKTPQADPAAELWNKYALSTTNKGTPLVKTAVFAHLINDSSPHSSATMGSVGGLRRWSSCGLEWPMSKTKRRRTTGRFREHEEDNLPREGLDDAPSVEQNKRSKVGLLVEQIQATMTRSPQFTRNRLHAPSSSSPLPEAATFHPDDNISPLQRLAPIRESKSDEAVNLSTSFRRPPSQQDGMDSTYPSKSREPQKNKSFEFDDGELDDAIFDAVDETAMSQTLSFEPDPTVSAHTNDYVDTALNTTSGYHNQTATPAPDVASDSFSDGEDLFAADMENIASLYDMQEDVVTQTANSEQERRNESNEQEDGQGGGLGTSAINDTSSDDEFGGDDIDVDQLAAVEAAATQAFIASGGTQNIQNTRQDGSQAIQRYLILDIVDGEYYDDKGRLRKEKVLAVEEERTKLIKAIALRDSWAGSPCTKGSYVHVIGNFTHTGECLITDSDNMLILHPDHLISATVVADSFGCTRRAVLQDRVKATSNTNAPQLYGHILHELFQEAMKANRWDTNWLMNTIEKIVSRHLESIAEIRYTVPHVLDHLKSKLPELQSWAAIFVKPVPTNNAKVQERNGKHITMAINKLLDVEEHVWSPTYGLKGNIDATVQAVMDDEDGRRTLTVPLEVKTGRNSNASHRAQTALYTLLLSDRYDIEVAYGVLYYLETSEMTRIPSLRHELIHMVQQRNQLACFVRERLELPPMLKNSHMCGKCYARDTCFLYHNLAEDGTGEDIVAKDKYDQLVKYLTTQDQEFFKKWNTLLTKEESEMMKFKRELWTMLSTERERVGRCFSEVVIEPGSAIEEEHGSKINRFRYTLLKHKSTSGFSFAESQIIIGEPIVISDEKGHYALANGYVTNVHKRRITVAVDRRLHNARTKQRDFHPQLNQSFAGIMDVSGMCSTEPPIDQDGPILYRLDKDEFSNGMATVRNNLIQMMDDHVYKSSSLRSLIIGNQAPTFKTNAHFNPLPGQSTDAVMNSDQKAAIEKVMSAQDYALVLGMPGTGKTTTIAHIIRALVAKGKSVLLTSYTHTAVDNILLKIRHDNIGILRLGTINKVHPEVQEFAILGAQQKESLEELERSWEEPQVVATTCLTINHPIFSRRIFDYCIVDEASQITLPVCLGPIRMANTFVLVGDHFQLPPLVQNKEALEGGLDVSLFKSLSEQHPEAVVTLGHQYRMCSDVMLLSNHLIYDGRLKCGNEAVARRTLAIPRIEGMSKHHAPMEVSFQSLSRVNATGLCQGYEEDTCWIGHILKSQNKVVFINTDTLAPNAFEVQAGSRITNATEAVLTSQLVESLLATGVDATEIGVITFYRSQLAVLKQSLRHHSGVEMHTADKFQGRDKEAIIVSCVRSNEAGNVGDLLKDWRRINVAVTRARSKLVIMGSVKTLGTNELLKNLITLCDSKGWMMNLPTGATDSHIFEEFGTQTTGTQGGKSPINKSQLSPIKKRRTIKSPITNGRQALLDISPSKSNSRLKLPAKTGVLSKKSLLGSRPVLRDIVNDVI